jgi:hypothetical protein
MSCNTRSGLGFVGSDLTVLVNVTSIPNYNSTTHCAACEVELTFSFSSRFSCFHFLLLKDAHPARFCKNFIFLGIVIVNNVFCCSVLETGWMVVAKYRYWY